MRSFAMFSDAGDVAVAALVSYAQTVNMPWPEVLKALEQLANLNPDLYGEATDTAVRECVYDALNMKTPFYA